jgi:hypothetical protein
VRNLILDVETTIIFISNVRRRQILTSEDQIRRLAFRFQTALPVAIE